MKINKTIVAALLALGVISQASADPIVYVTGSTAFRSTVYAALANNTGTANGGVFDTGTVTAETWGNASANGADFMVFHGNISGVGYYIDCAWSGSEAGMASSCNASLQNVDRNGSSIALKGSPETWVNATNPLVSLTWPVNTNSASQSAYLEGGSHGADMNFADTSQTVSWTPKVTGTATDLKSYGQIGVVTFTITKNNQTGNSGSGIPAGASSSWSNVTNVTLAEMNILLASGEQLASFFTGNIANDSLTSVYLVGRNLGSGTRMNMLCDSTYGGHRPVQQYSIGYGVEETQVNSLILTNEGNGGYESGGSVAKACGVLGSCQQADPINSGTNWFALGYVGPSDALNTANYGGEPVNCWVTVDGVPSNNGTIENGQWWYWGNEYLYGKHNNSGSADTVANQLATSIKKTLLVLNYGVTPGNHDPSIPLTLMNVSKSTDVAFPSY
jgi:hypothetical protein